MGGIIHKEETRKKISNTLKALGIKPPQKTETYLIKARWKIDAIYL